MSLSHIPSSKLTNDELQQLSLSELIRRLRTTDQERVRAMKEQSSMMKDFNQRMQVNLVEIRTLKDVNQRLQVDNQELRDLCCFLDDERQKGRKLAKEWQRFGRYTSGVMRSEVSTYQEKLKELEARQQELMQENYELKELCVLMTERGADLLPSSSDRDLGDGSSNSSGSATEKPLMPKEQRSHTQHPPIAVIEANNVIQPNRPQEEDHADESLHYVRELEERIRVLEDEKRGVTNVTADSMDSWTQNTDLRQVISPPRPGHRFFSSPHLGDSSLQHPDNPLTRSSRERSLSPGCRAPSPSKPEAVVDAMKVLEIHEQLERPSRDIYNQDELDPTHKALVREMCNVVWRKLGDAVPGYKTTV